MLSVIEKWVIRLTEALNWIAAAAVALMTIVTCADILLRLIRRPIPGSYEIVGLLGAVFVSFSLAYTSLKRGHIVVDFLVAKLSKRGQTIFEITNASVCSLFFAIVTRQCLLYAASMRSAGEVSMTLQLPIYPFIYGIALGCASLSAVLLLRFLQALALFSKTAERL